MSNELPIPPIAASDPDACEIARIWAARGTQHIALATGLWDDPAAWGIMLVELVNHVANAYEQEAGLDRSDVLARIREGFDAEWESPTDEAQGDLLSDADDG
jgi:hypothetical protein